MQCYEVFGSLADLVAVLPRFSSTYFLSDISLASAVSKPTIRNINTVGADYKLIGTLPSTTSLVAAACGAKAPSTTDCTCTNLVYEADCNRIAES
jgi:hypothetical protein